MNTRARYNALKFREILREMQNTTETRTSL